MAKKMKITRTDFHKDPSWTDGPYKPVNATNTYNYVDAWSQLLNIIAAWYNPELNVTASDTKLSLTLEIYEED